MIFFGSTGRSSVLYVLSAVCTKYIFFRSLRTMVMVSPSSMRILSLPTHVVRVESLAGTSCPIIIEASVWVVVVILVSAARAGVAQAATSANRIRCFIVRLVGFLWGVSDSLATDISTCAAVVPFGTLTRHTALHSGE